MVKITSKNEKLSLDRLEVFEKEHDIRFSTEYRKFLLNYNGGYPDKSTFKIKGEDGEYESILNVLYGIGEMYDNLEKNFDIFDELVDVGFVPIADDPGGNQICISINKENYGAIYFWEHELGNEDELENLFYIAANFDEFLTNLYE
ncbi:hypothetical protein PWEIH_02222 [Listeria weihenstephanensis FSL R9-0317]|uniref:Knr4/Smi1-like domain-containing protein n=1 Tax=Listeria weihenstephanensis TaxID=1006155 RepID=A0A1S7FQU8_9LIST|nr:SMI1/KNR4 family protein [Listeria weihenstephanensis]AQY49783.1 hypothetical protein UE46_01045 [Listeria weihenstephanensis]EUJ41086.1 hypothetical protein PWEIH_02222 [Listeria weihenstephanensis FSL R9-0317]